jgi:tetratricopeptide (TPR) repeat protein
VLSKAFAILACVMALAPAARAQAVPPAGDTPAGLLERRAPDERPDRPWANGVPDAAQRRALVLFEAGNKLFENSEHAAALAMYRQALSVWDHPAIRYNAAVALINLDQPLAANENLELALRYGDAPFSPATYQQALTYRKLVRGQTAELRVTCAEESAEVTLDGQVLFVSPGEATRWLAPGPHQLVARKEGFLVETRLLNLLPGKPAEQSVSLHPVPKMVRRWPTWKPWAVLGTGAALALAGVPMILEAKKNIDGFDREVARNCPAGCSADAPELAAAHHLRDRSHLESVMAVSLFAVGGALLAGGAAMLVSNQPRVVSDEPRLQAAIVPAFGPGAFGLSLALAH